MSRPPPPFPSFCLPPRWCSVAGDQADVAFCLVYECGEAELERRLLVCRDREGWEEGREGDWAHTHTHTHTHLYLWIGYIKKEKLKLFLQDDVAWEDRVWGGKTKFVTWWWVWQDRGKTSGRDDDNIEAIKKRFKVTPREISNAYIMWGIDMVLKWEGTRESERCVLSEMPRGESAFSQASQPLVVKRTPADNK